MVDLGCGDGRVLRAACRRYGVRAVGYEVNPMAFLVARFLSYREKRIEVKLKNFWREDLGDARIVFCYLFPDVMKKLARKLEKELRPGARVVSCNFPVPGWQPTQILHPDAERHSDPIYVYMCPVLGATGRDGAAKGTVCGG